MEDQKNIENNISIGNAGEYFVAGELERHGLTVAVPMSNTKDFDILAINRTSYNQYAIQVKTTGKVKKDWLLNNINKMIYKENIIFIFVCLNGMKKPEYHIVPSEIVYKKRDDYNNWINTPGKNGKLHDPQSNKIHFKDNENIYLDKWDYLQ